MTTKPLLIDEALYKAAKELVEPTTLGTAYVFERMANALSRAIVRSWEARETTSEQVEKARDEVAWQEEMENLRAQLAEAKSEIDALRRQRDYEWKRRKQAQDERREVQATLERRTEMLNVSTSELDEFEIALARDANVLVVNDDGIGYVPKDWLGRIRSKAQTASAAPDSGTPKPTYYVPPSRIGKENRAEATKEAVSEDSRQDAILPAAERAAISARTVAADREAVSSAGVAQPADAGEVTTLTANTEFALIRRLGIQRDSKMWKEVMADVRLDLASTARTNVERVAGPLRERVNKAEAKLEHSRQFVKELEAQIGEWRLWASETLDLDSGAEMPDNEMRTQIGEDIANEYDHAQQAKKERDEARRQLKEAQEEHLSTSRQLESVRSELVETEKERDANAQAAKELQVARELAKSLRVGSAVLGDELCKLLGVAS